MAAKGAMAVTQWTLATVGPNHGGATGAAGVSVAALWFVMAVAVGGQVQIAGCFISAQRPSADPGAGLDHKCVLELEALACCCCKGTLVTFDYRRRCHSEKLRRQVGVQIPWCIPRHGAEDP